MFTDEQIETLRETQARWNELKNVKSLDLVQLGTAYCQCCTKFLNPFCSECPIAQFTGRAICKDTPYQEAADAFTSRDLKGFKKHATEECEFITALADGEFQKARGYVTNEHNV